MFRDVIYGHLHAVLALPRCLFLRGQCIDFRLSVGQFFGPFLAGGTVSAEVTLHRTVTDIRII